MVEQNCSDTACICKSQPFFQDQCREIKDACSQKDALRAVEVGTAICRAAGVPVECKNTPVVRGRYPTHASFERLAVSSNTKNAEC